MAATSKQDNVCAMDTESENTERDGENNIVEDFLPGFAKIQDFTKVGYRSLVEMTKMSNGLPDSENWPYFSSFPSFQDAMTSQGNQILKLMSTLMKSQGIRGNLLRRDLEEKFDLLLDCNDTLLERVALNLDEVAGIRKNPELVETEARKINRPLSGSWNQMQSPSVTTNSQSTGVQKSMNVVNKRARLLTTKVVEKPQVHFEDKVDNSNRPFEPRIKDKPHAKKPLSLLFEVTENGERYSHPYEYELDLYEPRFEHIIEVEPKIPRPLAETPCKYVDCKEGLKNMIKDLKDYKELAIDLEHHSYRSYQGFTCLLQISTHHCDYIVDTISLRSHLHVLNEIFTNPAILKVLHGGESDVEWLQKDLSLYLVNMFDTHIAGKLLGLPRLSLAFLVKYYCNIELDKVFQLADWRLRPLLPEMMDYARSDTHYLLYIHDCMQNQLWENGSSSDRLTKAALLQSNLLCKKIYIKPLYSEDSHLKLYQKSKKSFNNRQLWAFRQLHEWRDQTARKEDESIGYVLPNHMLLQIAETLPREMQGILACCNPIPPLVRQNLGHLHRLILQAREKPLIQTVAVEEETASAPKESWTKVNIESPLHCPHQLPPREEQSNLPTLLGGKPDSQILIKSHLLTSHPHISIMADVTAMSKQEKMAGKVLTPYQRYLLVKPYMQHLANQTAQAEAANTSANPLQVTSNQELSDQQRMERIKQHFMALDAAAQPPPVVPAPPAPETSSPESTELKSEPSSSDSEVEIIEIEDDEKEVEEKGPPSKKAKVEEQEEPTRYDVMPRSANSKKKKKKMAKMNRKFAQHVKNKRGNGQGSFPVQQPLTNIPPGIRVVVTQHDAGRAVEVIAPENMSSIEETFDYSNVDFGRFQGGSHQGKKKKKKQQQQNNRGRGGKGRGGKFSRGRGKKNNFSQKGQKSFTYRRGT